MDIPQHKKNLLLIPCLFLSLLNQKDSNHSNRVRGSLTKCDSTSYTSYAGLQLAPQLCAIERVIKLCHRYQARLHLHCGAVILSLLKEQHLV